MTASRMFRLACAPLLMLGIFACNGGNGDLDDVERITADGDVVLDPNADEDRKLYSLDAGQYAKWVVAQRALDSIPELTVPAPISLQRFTDEDIDRAADWLEDDERARQAIRSADLTPEQFVETSVAIAQLVATMEAAPPITSDLAVAPTAGASAPDANLRRTFAERRVRIVEDDDDDDDRKRGKGKDRDRKGKWKD